MLLQKRIQTQNQTSSLSFRECSAQSTAGLKGVCMTSSECNSNGYADGNCAAAFGVCCIQR